MSARHKRTRSTVEEPVKAPKSDAATEADKAVAKQLSANVDQTRRPVNVADEVQGYNLDAFCVPEHYQDVLEKILLPHGIILDRYHNYPWVNKLAQNIVEDFQHEALTCLCVLKGGHQFFADLFDAIKKINSTAQESVPLAIDFIRCSSYEDDRSTGEVKIASGDDLETTIKGKNVLIVEDMIDTGRTMVKLLTKLQSYKPKAIRVASLFVKRTHRSNLYKPHYTGFSIPDHFVVGYALDYNEHFRDLDHVAILNDHGKKKYATA